MLSETRISQVCDAESQRLAFCRQCKLDRPREAFATTSRGNRVVICKDCQSKLPDDKKRRQRIKAKIYHYNISLTKYLEMVEACGRKCEACGEPFGDDDGNICIDHCHKTNKVRGLLCRGCNIGIGFFGDSRRKLLLAAEYLRNRNHENVNADGKLDFNRTRSH